MLRMNKLFSWKILASFFLLLTSIVGLVSADTPPCDYEIGVESDLCNNENDSYLCPQNCQTLIDTLGQIQDGDDRLAGVIHGPGIYLDPPGGTTWHLKEINVIDCYQHVSCTLEVRSNRKCVYVLLHTICRNLNGEGAGEECPQAIQTRGEIILETDYVVESCLPPLS